MAVHTTSASWEDFRLTCSLLDIKSPNKDISKCQLTKYMNTSVDVANESKRFAWKESLLRGHSC